MQRGEHREEVLTRAAAPLWKLVWEVVLHPFELDAFRIEAFDAYLIISGRVADGDSGGFQQLLLAFEDLLQKGECNHALRRHEVLPTYRMS